MIEQKLMEFASASPDFAVGVEEISRRLSSTPIVAEDLIEAIQMLEIALQEPSSYPEMVQAAIADGLIDPGDAPEQYDAVFIISLLLALYGLRDSLNAQGMARGGLMVGGRHVANQGQGGDSMLAHINPREAEILRRMGGQGTVNPNTGIAEYKSLKKILKTVLPVALSIFMPGLGTAIGTGLGLSGTAAAVVGGGILGAGTSAITGGDPLRGALMGGISGGGGELAGNFVNKGLNLGLSAPVAATLGSGLVGGAIGAATGDGFAQGALQGAGGQLLKNIAPQGTPTNAWEAALQSGANTTGNMLTAGYTPGQAAQSGLTAGIFSGAQAYLKPSDSVVKEVKNNKPTNTPVKTTAADNYTQYAEDEIIFDLERGDILVNRMTNEPITGIVAGDTNIYENGLPVGTITENLGITTTGIEMNNIGQSGGDLDLDDQGMFSKSWDWAKANPLSALTLGATALSALEGEPDIQQAVSTLSPEQQEYFNKPLTYTDWSKVRLDANNANQTISQYLNQNLSKIRSGFYDTAAPQGNYRGGPIKRMNMGGLSQMSRYVEGPGTGRSDDIPAYLSDGEYVIDAETVAMLGDGSNRAGADKLDGFRENVRMHKGGNLTKGKFSKDAKSPLEYMRGIA